MNTPYLPWPFLTPRLPFLDLSYKNFPFSSLAFSHHQQTLSPTEPLLQKRTSIFNKVTDYFSINKNTFQHSKHQRRCVSTTPSFSSVLSPAFRYISPLLSLGHSQISPTQLTHSPSNTGSRLRRRNRHLRRRQRSQRRQLRSHQRSQRRQLRSHQRSQRGEFRPQQCRQRG